MHKNILKFQSPAGTTPGGGDLTKSSYGQLAFKRYSKVKTDDFSRKQYRETKKAAQDLYSSSGTIEDSTKQYLKNPDKPESAFATAMGKVPTGIGSMVGNAFADVGSMIGNKYEEDFSEEQKASQAAIRGALDQIPVFGPLISAATGIVDGIGSATGMNLSNIDKESADRAGVKGAATFNNIMNMLPGNSMLWGIWGGKRTDQAEKSEYIDGLTNAYSDAVANINAAGDLGNKRMLLQKRKTNEFINEQNQMNSLLHDIGETNTLRKKSNYSSDLAQQNLNRYAGTNYMDMRVGRNGLKLMSIEEVRSLLANRKIAEEAVEKFANGGVLEGGNVMPVGKLHKELHHIDDSDPELAEGLTRKGIPVVALSEGGEVEQVAEIERDEWIMTKELTDKIEALWKDGSEDAMIEAGKILVEELLFNTNDKNGIINDN